MGSKKLSRPKGTNDFYGSQAKDLARIEEIATETFRLYGFTEIRTPLFEHTELFTRQLGETSDVVSKEMYTFEDRADRSLTLRPEGTASVARALLENQTLNQGVDRFFYRGPMFRYERPQKGRYRQHFQIGVEAFGDPGPQVDVEVIACMIRTLQNLGLDELVVDLNSVGRPESRARYGQMLRESLAPQAEQFGADFQERLEKNPMRILDSKDPKVQAALDGLPVFSDFLDPEDQEHFAAVQDGLRQLEIPFRLNPRLVRGFDYYTQTAFEVFAGGLGAQNAVGGGGRYDGLVQDLGGPPTPGIGFAMGLERLALTLETFGKKPPASDRPGLCYLVTPDSEALQEAPKLSETLRAWGVPSRSSPKATKLKKQFTAANRLEARYAIILGEAERKEGKVSVKDLVTGAQVQVEPKDLKALVARPASETLEAAE